MAATVFVGLAAAPVGAQQPSPAVPPQLPADASPALTRPPPPANRYSSDEIIDAGHHFFCGVSKGIASIVEKAADQLPDRQGSGQHLDVYAHIHAEFIFRMAPIAAA